MRREERTDEHGEFANALKNNLDKNVYDTFLLNSGFPKSFSIGVNIKRTLSPLSLKFHLKVVFNRRISAENNNN